MSGPSRQVCPIHREWTGYSCPEYRDGQTATMGPTSLQFVRTQAGPFRPPCPGNRGVRMTRSGRFAGKYVRFIGKDGGPKYVRVIGRSVVLRDLDGGSRSMSGSSLPKVARGGEEVCPGNRYSIVRRPARVGEVARKYVRAIGSRGLRGATRRYVRLIVRVTGRGGVPGMSGLSVGTSEQKRAQDAWNGTFATHFEGKGPDWIGPSRPGASFTLEEFASVSGWFTLIGHSCSLHATIAGFTMTGTARGPRETGATHA